VGQAISSGPRWRSFSAFRTSHATLTSSSAWKVESEMRIVSPMPSASSVPRPTADFRDPRVRHAGGLDRDLEVLEVEALHELHELDRGPHQGLDRVLALQLVQVLRQGPGVDTDAHGHTRRLRLVGHLGDLVGAADVARIQPDAVRPGVDRLERQRVVEVDVRDDRDRGLEDDPPQRLDVLVAGDGAPHQVPPGLRDRANLAHGRLVIGRLGLRHRLDGDGRPAADLHPADVDLALTGHGSRVVAGFVRTGRANSSINGEHSGRNLARWRRGAPNTSI